MATKNKTTQKANEMTDQAAPTTETNPIGICRKCGSDVLSPEGISVNSEGKMTCAACLGKGQPEGAALAAGQQALEQTIKANTKPAATAPVVGMVKLADQKTEAEEKARKAKKSTPAPKEMAEKVDALPAQPSAQPAVTAAQDGLRTWARTWIAEVVQGAIAAGAEINAGQHSAVLAELSRLFPSPLTEEKRLARNEQLALARKVWQEKAKAAKAAAKK